MNILIRCDGSRKIGLGHVVRCLALADELSETYHCRITFAMRNGSLGIQKVKEKKYPVIECKNNGEVFNYKKWLTGCINNSGANVVILDAHDGLQNKIIDTLRRDRILIVTIDDPEDKRLSADLAFYPPVPQVKRIDLASFTGKLYAGWDWVILRKEFSQRAAIKEIHSSPRIEKSKFKILITMGSSDPQGMTINTVKALKMLKNDFEVTVVLGSGFLHKEELNRLLFDFENHVSLKENVKNMAKIMSQHDLAVTSFGVTAYELAAMGVPSIYLCLTEDHAESATSFVLANLGVSLGLYSNISNEDLALSISSLLNNPLQRLSMKTKAENLVNGCGVKKVAQIIKSEAESRQQIEYKSDKTATFS